jgi:predicted nucleic acid-binding protein
MATPSLPATLLLDTNVLIYHIRLALTDEVTQQLGEALKAGRAFISVITRIEMLAWKGHSDESLRQTTDLISLLPELPMSEAVIEQAIRIRKTFGLKLPDAVIAATALAHGLQLMTANESDFKRVVGLELLCI